MARRIFVTSALPYANGPIHIGHLLEYIQADSWVRFMRMAGHEVHFVCADDAHGTPIMLEAEKQGVPAEKLIERMRLEHLEDFTGFGVDFDNYHSTHSEENRKLLELIYGRLDKAGLIASREVDQLYDPERNQFLADRYIRGICPSCGAPDQPGDNCEACGAAYAATDLKEPRSALSGAGLEVRTSTHYFFVISKLQDFLKKWIATEDPGPGPGRRLQQEVENKLGEWFAEGLQDWDISRDAPYFGFAIPGKTDKYFYVWLDAPIGYMASFAQLCEREGIDFDAFWDRDSEAEVYHFIGKDIMNFHGLFWPAMLESAGYRTPTRLFVHGFLTVNGTKMSKSKGTFITASSYLDMKLDPDWFRYYIAGKLNDRVEDVDLHLGDFVNRINADLVGKLANIPSRVAKILARSFDNRLCDGPPAWIKPDLDRLAELYERRRFGDVTREVMEMAEEVNRALEQARPWELARDPGSSEELHRVCTAAIESFRLLVGILKPVIPSFAADAEKYLQHEEKLWQEMAAPLGGGHQLGRFTHLARRVKPEDLEKLQEANRETAAPETEHIGIEDFARVELRVAKVLAAEEVEGSKKLLKLRLSLGGGGERTVFAGIKGHVEPSEMVGRNVVMCANLAPRKMRFGVSEGMVLAAEGEGGSLHLLSVDDSCPAGASIS